MHNSHISQCTWDLTTKFVLVIMKVKMKDKMGSMYVTMCAHPLNRKKFKMNQGLLIEMLIPFSTRAYYQVPTSDDERKNKLKN